MSGHTQTSTRAVRAWRARRRAAGLPIHSPHQMVASRVYNAETYRFARASLRQLLGDRCVGCSHMDVRVLEFDHVHNNGAADRRRFKGARSMLLYYIAHPAEARATLQLLCRNCNWLKRRGDALPLGGSPAVRPHVVAS